jgi:hypothetical protein
MVTPRHQNARKNHNLMTANKSFKQDGKAQILGKDSRKSELNSRRS